ncbi:MAG: DUF512 domain-containing protein [Firmicutes bacterium]|nr:DUF512 domain-containing protein [Bacillota bacterium]MCL1953579.1 DUF512 domain-containing protein [Bacillota bacterium]
MNILHITPNSVAEELDIKAGDKLIGFDGKDKVDFIDYQYYSSQEEFVMSIQQDGDIVDFEIVKSVEEDLGLEFEDNIAIKQCRNKCAFCFIDQNPPNVRKSLHIKDDDYRMSVVSGNFITLTNLKEEDYTRIISYGLSPLYVSVHSTDTATRQKLLGNLKAKPVLPILEMLHAHGIVIHAQIVYCPTINEDYVKSIKELSPFVKSTAIVPLGLTKYSKNGLVPVTKDMSIKVVQDIEELQKQGYKAYCGDEFYFKAELELPDYESYDDFEQISNGVGIVRQFDREFDEQLAEVDKLKGKYTIITGTLATDLMKGIASKCNAKGATVQVITAKSLFFGGDVSCAGLVTGGDIISACQGIDLSTQDKVIIPKTMLKEFEDIFLDDMLLSQVEQAIGHAITVSAVDGVALLEHMM